MRASNIEVLGMLVALQDQASPIIHRVSAAINSQSEDMLPATVEGLRELPQILDRVKRLPKPTDKQFAKSIRLFSGGMGDYLRALKIHMKAAEKAQRRLKDSKPLWRAVGQFQGKRRSRNGYGC